MEIVITQKDNKSSCMVEVFLLFNGKMEYICSINELLYPKTYIDVVKDDIVSDSFEDLIKQLELNSINYSYEQKDGFILISREGFKLLKDILLNRKEKQLIGNVVRLEKELEAAKKDYLCHFEKWNKISLVTNV